MNESVRFIKSAEASFEERQLVFDVLRKDRKATAEFVARYSDAVYAYVRHRLMPRPELVPDLVQEVFLAAWQNLGKFQGDSLRAWLIGIARHKIEDFYRRRLRDIEVPNDGFEPAVLPMIEEQIDGSARRAKVLKTLARMPEGYAVALLWRYLENRSVREMAQQTGKTEKAMERVLARARQEFRRRWTDGPS